MEDISPFSARESIEFHKMVERFIVYYSIVYTFFTYVFIVMAEGYILEISEYLLYLFKPMAARYNFLKMNDGLSHVAYIGTLLSAIIFFITSIVILVTGHWWHVISKNRMIPQRPSLKNSLMFMFIIGACLAGVFFAPLDGRGYRDGVFYWPFFPAFGITSTLGLVLPVFSIYVYILKDIFFGGD